MTAYIYPTTATFVEEIDETRSLVEEHWANGDYTLISRRTRKSDGTLTARRWSVQAAEYGIPEISAPSGSVAPTFGVNWSAMGVRDTLEARKYADRISDAARAADRFSLIVETVDSE